MKEWILAAIFAGLAAIGGVMSRVIFKKKPDNYIEEFAEKIIKDQTGIKVDLSPASKDPDNFYVIDMTDTLKKKEEEQKS